MDAQQPYLYHIMIQCLKKDPSHPKKSLIADLSDQDWQKLLEMATMQRIAPLLWHHLKQKDLQPLLPETIVSQLRNKTRSNTLNNLRLNGEMSRLLTALKEANIPLILLKGIVLSNTVYESIGLREMNDIDVLAKPCDLQQIADILTGMGYRPMQPYSFDLSVQIGHHLPRFIKQNAAHFEIHWNITPPGKNYSIDPQGLWERALPVRITGHETQMLSGEDMLLHLCLHTSYLHPFSFGLRPFCDISRLIDHLGPSLDWQTVANRAISQSWQRGVYAALYLASELADASVPANVLEKLKPEDMPDLLMDMIRTQIFTDKSFANSIPTPFAQLLESGQWKDKIKIFFQRVFLPRTMMANLYGVPIHSMKLYAYYLKRVFDVIRRHQNTLKKYQQSNSSIKSLSERTLSIADWMK